MDLNKLSARGAFTIVAMIITAAFIVAGVIENIL